MADPDYAERLAREIETFAGQTVVHNLPGIHHYYASQHVSPMLLKAGYLDGVDFFVKNIAGQAAQKGSASIVSYGAGNGELELELAKRMLGGGLDGIHFDCVDVNVDMLQRAQSAATAAGLAPYFTFLHADVTRTALPRETYDVHIAHQSLHHIVDLERLYSVIESGMTDASLFLAADVIGRNGHMRWPETLAIVERLWQCLLRKHRYNHQLGRMDDEFVNFDCSEVGFEGIRAQDVLPLLAERFTFEEFVGWGGIVDPFVDRSYGPNFDPASLEDRRFIDHVARIESTMSTEGTVKPTHMLARLRRRGSSERGVDVGRFVRREPPSPLPDVSAVTFAFARSEEVLTHEVRGATTHLGSGFHGWEESTGIRWTGREFTVTFDLPRESAPFSCSVSLDVLPPTSPAEGGATFFANGVRVGRVETVYQRLAAKQRLVVEFETFGGSSSVTVALDRPQHPPDSRDRRELGVVLTRFKVNLTRT